MASMGELFNALAGAIAALTREVRDGETDELARLWTRSSFAAADASKARRGAARLALEGDDHDDLVQIEGEWLNYAALLVQVDRIVADLAAPLPE